MNNFHYFTKLIHRKRKIVIISMYFLWFSRTRPVLPWFPGPNSNMEASLLYYPIPETNLFAKDAPWAEFMSQIGHKFRFYVKK